MGEKHKDKEKKDKKEEKKEKKRGLTEEEIEAKRLKHEARIRAEREAEERAKKAKESGIVEELKPLELKPVELKPVDNGKDKKEKKDKKDKKEKKEKEPAKSPVGSPVEELTVAPAPAAAAAAEEPPQKKTRKAAMDDIDMESDDEEPAPKAAEPKAEEGKEEEPDALDAFMSSTMTELKQQQQEAEERLATKAARPAPAQSISFEEIQLLMGLSSAAHDEEGVAASSSQQAPTPSSSSTAPPPSAAPASSSPAGEEEEDEFYKAFVAEMKRKQTGNASSSAAGVPTVTDETPKEGEFIESAAWTGVKKGYVFTTRAGRTGYYVDKTGEKLAQGGKPPAIADTKNFRLRIPSVIATAESGVDMLGFTPSAFPPKDVFIKSVDPGSWAEQSGLLAGDELVMVNGKDVHGMDKSEMLAFMRTRPVILALARNSRAESTKASVKSAKAKGVRKLLLEPEEPKVGKAPEPKKMKELDELDLPSISESEDEEDPEKAAEKKAAAAAVAKEAAQKKAESAGKAAILSDIVPDEDFENLGNLDPKKLSKKEQRKLRKEKKDKEKLEKAEAAKKQFGGDDERMESENDLSEASTEEEPESYFDLVKRFTTKKSLPEVDHAKVKYTPFKKNLYIQVKEITNMKDHEVDDLRRTHGGIIVRGKQCPRPIKSFVQCGLPGAILKIFEKRDYENPFPIQMQGIPALMCGRDVIAVAQTGSGKTLTYLLPMLRQCMDQPPIQDGDGPIGFIIAPTRELALQIQREANVLAKAVNLRSVCAYGGGPLGEQLALLKKGAEILVGTPGRLIDVLTTSNGKITNMKRVTFLVLDEADRMFDMGFEPQIGMFLQNSRPDKQVALFSATLPTHVEALARTVLKKPLEITVGERNTAATNVVQQIEVLDESQKFYRLLQLLGEWHEHGSIIIFVHQQKDVDEMFTELLKYGYPALALHGAQDQHDRDFTLQDFKDNVANILIATSVAARGIDVKQVILVVNFKVPDHLEDYIHRIGRTGRAGKAGFAYTFIQPDEGDRAQDMVDALRQCGQKVPDKLRRLSEDYQSLINAGQAQKKRKWGGFGGKSFKYDNTEKSQQQKDRQRAKAELMVGDANMSDEEELKDPWMEDKPMNQAKRPEDKKKEEVKIEGSDARSTAAMAAQVAEKLRLEQEKAKTIAASNQGPAPLQLTMQPNADSKAPPVAMALGKTAFNDVRKKTEQEIDFEAKMKAEESLANLEEHKRKKLLPSVIAKIKAKIKAEQETAPAQPVAPKPPPPPEKKATPESGVPATLPSVPGIIGLPEGAQPAPSMVSKSMEALKEAAGTKEKMATALQAEQLAATMMGRPTALTAVAGTFMDEFEINDYPQVARQRISHRDPMLQIEELTGAKCWVKGQYFADERKMPPGSKKLYVEITGSTAMAVQKGKQEVRRMMEALAIRTLNIPGLTAAVIGKAGRYDPAVGM
eukprot:TRINITY_DN23_c2_g1_i1.p1 TRINITY_DN23_c2_g1~~TRINITY_DN23_c2_g1_i1.p1  ORF type:complete len:1441 (-),score=491.69 TRINITY_DN23_c2_g1_i1:25-4347(-)